MNTHSVIFITKMLRLALEAIVVETRDHIDITLDHR